MSLEQVFQILQLIPTLIIAIFGVVLYKVYVGKNDR